MNEYDVAEIAYKHGYESGYAAALKDLLNNYNKCDMTIPQLISYIAKVKEIKI